MIQHPIISHEKNSQATCRRKHWADVNRQAARDLGHSVLIRSVIRVHVELISCQAALRGQIWISQLITLQERRH